MARNWCVTAYGPSVETLVSYVKTEPSELTYAVLGEEKCPTTGRLHGQGYFQFAQKKRMRFCQQRAKASWLIARGTAAQNRTYCTKEGKILVEYGTPVEQGRRTDLEHVRDLIKEGKPDSDVFDAVPSAMRLNLSRVRQAYMKPINRPVEVQWLYGPGGTGKTRRADDENPDAFWVPIPQGESVWFDGYNGEKTIVIDDFSIGASLFKRVCDRYPLRVPTKGGHVAALWTKVVVTSNYRPEEIYSDHRDWDAIRRRITLLEHVI